MSPSRSGRFSTADRQKGRQKAGSARVRKSMKVKMGKKPEGPPVASLFCQLQFAIALMAIVPLLALSYVIFRYLAPEILSAGEVVAFLFAVMVLMLTGTRMIFSLIGKAGGGEAAAPSVEERARLEALQSVEEREGRSIRHTVAEATALIGVIPLLAFGYVVVRYVHPVHMTENMLLLTALIAAVLLLGMQRIRQLTKRILSVAYDAKVVRLEGGRPRRDGGVDEIGELSVDLDGIAAKLSGRAVELRQAKAFVEHLPHPLLIADMSGAIEIANPSAEEMLGYSRDELKRTAIRSLFADRGAAGSLFAGDAEGEKETVWVRKDGTRVPVSIRGGSLSLDGAKYGIVVVATELTGRRLMEQANRRLAEITRHARDGVILTDARGRTTYVNPAFEGMTGYRGEELLGGDPADLIVADDTKAIGDEIRSAVMENGEWTGELLCRRKNGEVYPVESRVFTIRNAEGELVEIAAIQQDISERRRADSALRESEQRYRSLFTDSPISLLEEDFSEVKKYIDDLKNSGVRDFRRYFEKHPEGVGRCASMVKIVDVNSATLDMYEAESKEELQDDLRRLFRGETYGTFREELIAIAEGKTSFQCDCVAQTLKGATKYTSLSWSVSPDREDDLSKVLVSIVDITERKMAEEKLSRYALIFRSIDEALVISTNDGVIIDVNPAAEKMCSWSRDELVGRKAGMVNPPELAGRITEEITRGMEKEGVWRGEVPLLTKSGERRTLSTVVSYILDSSDNRIGTIGINRDITDIKRAQEKLRASANRWNATFDAISDAVSLMDAECRFQLCNRAMVELVGRPAGEIIGKTCYEVVHGTSEPPDWCPFQRMLKSRRKETADMMLKGRWFNVAVDPLQENGRLLGGVHILADITERKRAEKALSESEGRFRMLFEKAPLAYQSLNEDGYIIDVNTAWLEVMGYGRADVIGRWFGDFLAPESAGWFREQFPLFESAGEIQGIELEMLGKGGRRLTVLFSGRAAHDKTGRFRQAHCTFQDIGERKRTEERHSFIIETALDGFWTCDAEGTIVEANRAACEMLGYSRTELLGMRIFDIDAIETPGETQRRIEKILRSGRDRFETSQRRKDGRMIDVEVNVSYEKGASQFWVFTHDVTFRKRAEERFRLTAGVTTDLIYEWDSGDDSLEWFGDIDTTLGREEGGIPRTIQGWLDLIHPEDRERLKESVERHRTSTEPIVEEYRVQHSDGRWLSWVDRGMPVLDRKGIPVRWIGGCTDVTESKRAEERLRHTQKLEAVGHLAGGFAHDFNNILAGIVGYASLLEKALGEKSPLCADAEAIVRLSHRGAGLTKALLAFARKGKYNPRILEVNEVIGAALEIIAETVGKGMEIRPELSRDIPGVFADEEQLRQVVMNLCINACEAMRGGGTMTVRSACTVPDEGFFKIHDELKRGPYVLFSVSDTGGGIDADTHSRIFEPFFSTKEQKAGTGLGLSMVLGIIEGHDGCVEVESAPDRGSTFTIYLPAVEGKGVAAGAQGDVRGGEGILVVDDEQDIRRSTRRWLEEFGYTVLEAAGGKEALDLLEKEKGAVNLILLDMVMKGMSGTKTLEELKKAAPDLPVIICTGYSTDISRQMLLRGASGIIQKPFNPDALALKVRDILDR